MKNTIHNNIKKQYLNEINWITFGITNDAIYLSVSYWFKGNDAKYDVGSFRKIKNTTWNEKLFEMQTIKELNKW